MNQPLFVSIQVALPKEFAGAGVDPMERTWRTGFFKQPVFGAVRVTRTNLAGDGQADLENHGGFDKAVCVYPADHYAWWREELDERQLPYGAFGENFSIRGLDETLVCIGDVWAAADVRFQVSQPRVPCWKLARRWRRKELPAIVLQTGRTGWYFRVLQEGHVVAGERLALAERLHPDWTIERANRVMHREKHDLEAAAALAALPQLAQSWRGTLLSRVASRHT